MSRWIRTRVLYTPPVTPWELGVPKVAELTRKGGRCLRQNQWLGWSRNKVAVPEGAAGSPPFKETVKSRNPSRLRSFALRASVLILAHAQKLVFETARRSLRNLDNWYKYHCQYPYSATIVQIAMVFIAVWLLAQSDALQTYKIGKLY